MIAYLIKALQCLLGRSVGIVAVVVRMGTVIIVVVIVAATVVRIGIGVVVVRLAARVRPIDGNAQVRCGDKVKEVRLGQVFRPERLADVHAGGRHSRWHTISIPFRRVVCVGPLSDFQKRCAFLELRRSTKANDMLVNALHTRPIKISGKLPNAAQPLSGWL